MSEAKATKLNEETARIVAAIDIGSNSLRLSIAEVLGDGKLAMLEQSQRAVRLGLDTFRRGRLGVGSMRAAMMILRDYRRRLDTYGVHDIRAVATCAVREAANADAFVDRSFIVAGMDVEVIDPTEESRLTVSAVRQTAGEILKGGKGLTLITEVGGGSTVLTVLKKGVITASLSLDLGSVRLPETLCTADETPEHAAELMRGQIANSIQAIAETLRLKDVRTFISLGADMRFTARQVGRPTDYQGLSVVGRKAFGKHVGQCDKQTPAQLVKRYNLPFAEAETITPALLVYEALLEATSAQRIHVAKVSMRDGLLFDLARGVTGQKDPEMSRSVLESALAVARKYQVNLDHAKHVMTLSARLFDELQDEHRLQPRHRLLLRVAALLHELGGFITSRAHHKHSYYLIAHAELFGLTRDETLIVANIARYHRRALPRSTHIEYMMLPRNSRMIVSKLSAILRVADALDRSHTQHVVDWQCEQQEDRFILRISGAGDLSIERHAMIDKANLFEDLYGMAVTLEEGPLSVGDRRRDKSTE